MRRPTLIVAAIVFAVFLILDTAGLLELFAAVAWNVVRRAWPWLLAGCVMLAGFLWLRQRKHRRKASPRRRGRTSRTTTRPVRARGAPAARTVSSRRRLR